MQARCRHTFSDYFPAIVYRAGIRVSAGKRSQRAELSCTIPDGAIALCGQLVTDDFGAIIQGRGSEFADIPHAPVTVQVDMGGGIVAA